MTVRLAQVPHSAASLLDMTSFCHEEKVDLSFGILTIKGVLDPLALTEQPVATNQLEVVCKS
jgi:hypothetical protein